LMTLYKDQPQGHPPVPPAQLALAGSVAKLPFGGRIRKWDLEKSMTWEPQLSCFR
jgi:hypothetical protein